MKNYISVAIIAVAILIATFMLTNAFTHRNKSSNTISVTGSGNQDFTSDLIVWSASFSRKSMELRSANESIDRDRQQIKTYLLGKNIPEDEIVFSAVNFNKDFNYIYNDNGTQQSIFNGYNLTQTVTIQSKNVGKDISQGLKTLIGGELKAYNEMMNDARAIATKRMVEEATNLGADAVVNIRYASSAIMQGAAEVIVYGTAVTFK